jgi:hypothetical protein
VVQAFGPGFVPHWRLLIPLAGSGRARPDEVIIPFSLQDAKTPMIAAGVAPLSDSGRLEKNLV